MALVILLVAIVLLVLGYIYYGRWVAGQWGIDPSRETPAVTMADGVDYVAAKPAVLMGHHFSSIAGAGPINGPVQASIYGWIPVFLWCVLGGIFIGGLHDWGSLFASVRHGGKSIGDVIGDSMGKRAHKLFLIFALLVLVLVVASFVNVVAGTFMSDRAGFVSQPTGNETTAIISMLFIVLAIVYGLLTNRAGLGIVPGTIIGIVCIIAFLFIGMKVGLAASRTFWIVFIGAYIAIASLVPVWILLQPRDYLSSYLLYGMMILAIIGVLISSFSSRVNFALPAFQAFGGKEANLQNFIVPTLFITVACGACSGFHSLVASGTSSKQIASEKDLQPIGYGAMLIESALGIISLLAVGMVFEKYTSGGFGSPAAAFAGGIATMFGEEGTGIYTIMYGMLTLAVSVFALTSLDTATRLSRFMFSELFLKEGEASWKDATGVRKVLCHPLFGTLLMVVIGCVLGGLKLSAIWGLFGSANQLLAGLALMAVATWLGEVGKNNKMLIPGMIFMLVMTIWKLILTVVALFGKVGAGAAAWGDWFQLVFAVAMLILAVILVIEGIQTLGKQKAAKKA